jgi:PPM family protein phosphatase
MDRARGCVHARRGDQEMMSGKRTSSADESLPDTEKMPSASMGSEETVAAVATKQVLRAAASTDEGKVRELNEDSWHFEELDDEVGLYAVADGMGGHDRGEVASALAIETLFKEARSRLERTKRRDIKSLKRLLRTSFANANRSVLECGRENESNMGTTLTTVLVHRGSEALFANVGDSRAYLLREGRLEQVTRDHSLVAYLVQMGELTREQARTHPSGNILVRSVGSTDDVEIDVFHIPLQAGDALMLCTDGLWSELPDEDLQQVMVSTPDPQVICDEMVVLGNEAGGKDNITCLVVTM